MTGAPGEMTETPYRGGCIGSGWRQSGARRAAIRREELGRSKRRKTDFWAAAGPIVSALDFRVIGVLAVAPVHSFLRKCLGALLLLRQRAGAHCVNRADRAVRHFVHDPLDDVSAATALSPTAEVVIDLTHPQPLRCIRKHGPKLMVTEHVARADDHDLS